MLGRNILLMAIGSLVLGSGIAWPCGADERALQGLCREMAVQAVDVLEGVEEVGIDIKLPEWPCPYLRPVRLEQILGTELGAIGLRINPRSKTRLVWDLRDAQKTLASGAVPSFRMIFQLPTAGETTKILRIVNQKSVLETLAEPEPFDVNGLAQEIVDRLDDLGIRSVEEPKISDVAGAHHASFSSALKAALADQISKRNASIEIRTQRGESRIVGTTKLVNSIQTGSSATLELAVALLRQNDEPIGEPARVLLSPSQLSEADLIEVAAPTGTLSIPARGESTAQPIVQVAAGRQAPVLIEGQIRCGETSPYGFQVYATELDVDETGKPYLRLLALIEPTIDQGVVKIPVRQGQNLAIVMHNRDSFDAALKVEIDGLSSFAFAQVSQLPLYYSPSRQEPIIVDRWYFNDESGYAFSAGAIEQGAYRLRTADPSRLGKIRLTVHRVYQEGQAFDREDEPYLAGTRGAPLPPGSGLAIARGPRVPGQIKTVDLPPGRAREVLTIVYVPEPDEASL